MWTVQVASFVLVLVLLAQSWALPVEKTQSSSAEMLDRLRKMTEPTKRTRPAPNIPESQQPISKKDATPDATTTTTTTSAPSVGDLAKNPEPPAQSSENEHSFVVDPVPVDPDQNTLIEIQNHLANFQSNRDPYNQIQVIPLSPPVLSHNNYLEYMSYMRNRQNSIVDRFTNFAGNFFPIEIDVPDLIGSLTSWIPGAQLIGQIFTGNRPNSRRFAILGGNGRVYLVDVPVNHFQATSSHVRMPYPQPYPPPYNNFGTAFRPYVHQNTPFNSFFSRNSPPHPPPVYHPGFQNVPFAGDYPEIQTQDSRYDFIQSRINEMGPSLSEEEYPGGFENNPNLAILSNQRYNGNLHIPEDGVLVHNERSLIPPGSLFPEGRSLKEPESFKAPNN